MIVRDVKPMLARNVRFETRDVHTERVYIAPAKL